MKHPVAAGPRHSGQVILIASFCFLAVVLKFPLSSASSEAAETAAERGWRHLRENAYLPPDFDQTVFENLWRRWPDELRQEAESASPAKRRRMTFSYYGLMEFPDDRGE